MMIRKIIEIDETLCNGCGACASACHEGAIGMVDGKARLLRDDYCDGLGDCLPICPTDAIKFVEREAEEYDEAAVKAEQAKRQGGGPLVSQLSQWPLQIKLIAVNASFLDGSHLLVAADCCAYAYGNFHHDFMKNKVTLIGCPKLDQGDYSEKLTEILRHNDIRSVTVARMEVPCCGGMEHAVKTALEHCGKQIPWQVALISTTGRRLEI